MHERTCAIVPAGIKLHCTERKGRYSKALSATLDHFLCQPVTFTKVIFVIILYSFVLDFLAKLEGTIWMRHNLLNMIDAKWFGLFQSSKMLQKYVKNAFSPNDLADKLCITNKQISLESWKFLALRSASL